jgi:hypothetical protein
VYRPCETLCETPRNRAQKRCETGAGSGEKARRFGLKVAQQKSEQSDFLYYKNSKTASIRAEMAANGSQLVEKAGQSELL